MQIDQSWAQLAINTCVERGIHHFFLAPGSRCTPLTLAVARHENAIVTQHFDERGLAYAALGYARATGKPGVFVCTSGTAVANAFPAVIEAAMEQLPMILFTADRPPELRGTGANQTIDQQKIFGDYITWFFDMPCPTEAFDSVAASGLTFVRSQVLTAIRQARSGPVQINWMFREPFGVDDLPKSAFVGQTLEQPDGLSMDPEKFVPDPACGGCRSPLRCVGDTIVAVGSCRPSEAAAAESLAKELNAPLVADIGSQLRSISPDVPTKFNLPAPRTVVHVGGRIVSKAWWSYTSTLPVAETRFYHCSSKSVRLAPHHLPVEQIVGPVDAILRSVQIDSRTSEDFRAAWQQAQRTRNNAIRSVLEQDNVLSEPGIALAVGQQIPRGHGLFIGNSTPIRDMDWYSDWPREQNVLVGANRGASGIDGLIASAAGFAKGAERPTTLLLGDLSALHDLNSFALVAQSAVPMIMIVVNNHGGGIFDFLPIATNTEYFERYFVTPHQLGFERAAVMFGLRYEPIATIPEFKAVYGAALQSGASAVLELATDRKYNMEVRKRIDAEMAT